MPRRPPHATLGLALRLLREERDLSQEELASRASLHVTYVSGIERGLRNPTWDVVVALAAALGTPLAELVDRYDAAQR